MCILTQLTFQLFCVIMKLSLGDEIEFTIIKLLNGKNLPHILYKVRANWQKFLEEMDLVEVEIVASQTLLSVFVPYSSVPGYAKSLDLTHVQNEEAYQLMLHTLNQLKKYNQRIRNTRR